MIKFQIATLLKQKELKGIAMRVLYSINTQNIFNTFCINIPGNHDTKHKKFERSTETANFKQSAYFLHNILFMLHYIQHTIYDLSINLNILISG